MLTNKEIQEALRIADKWALEHDVPYYNLASAYRAAIAERDRAHAQELAVSELLEETKAERDLYKRQYEDAMNHALAYVCKPHFAEFRELQERHAAERAKERT